MSGAENVTTQQASAPVTPAASARPDPAILAMQLRRQELTANDPARIAAAEQIGAFELAQREATAMSQSSMLPPAFCEYRFDKDGNVLRDADGNPRRNPEALSNCMIVIEYARRLRMAPLAVIQNVDIIHGRPGLRSTFLIGTVNTCGRFTPLRFKQVGTPGTDSYGYMAYATSREDGELCEGVPITWEMVKAEGWHSKSGSKWKTMPEQMFRYRAATFWTRIYAPELSMGLRPADELEDVGDAPKGRIDVATVARSRALEEKLGVIVPAVPPSEPASEPAPKSAPKAAPVVLEMPEVEVDPVTGEVVPPDVGVT